ncbi:hypothetical protein [Rhodococcoides navarretei]|uniref:Uncharacterized protein n=1 Tax=Rhodococcus navarretei TaxID=3128981 RepID=A0ABU9D3F5_9NOCA
MIERYEILKRFVKADVLEIPKFENVVSEYWVAEPFIKIVIFEDLEYHKLRYFAIEPSLNVEEVKLIASLIVDLRRILTLLDVSQELEERAKALVKNFERLTREYGIEVESGLYARMLYYLFREFFGFSVIEPLMVDPNVEDISCDGYDIPIFVYHKSYGYLETNIRIPQDCFRQTRDASDPEKR